MMVTGGRKFRVLFSPFLKPEIRDLLKHDTNPEIRELHKHDTKPEIGR
jgi:hypothetical protein